MLQFSLEVTFLP